MITHTHVSTLSDNSRAHDYQTIKQLGYSWLPACVYGRIVGLARWELKVSEFNASSLLSQESGLGEMTSK